MGANVSAGAGTCGSGNKLRVTVVPISPQDLLCDVVMDDLVSGNGDHSDGTWSEDEKVEGFDMMDWAQDAIVGYCPSALSGGGGGDAINVNHQGALPPIDFPRRPSQDVKERSRSSHRLLRRHSVARVPAVLRRERENTSSAQFPQDGTHLSGLTAPDQATCRDSTGSDPPSIFLDTRCACPKSTLQPLNGTYAESASPRPSTLRQHDGVNGKKIPSISNRRRRRLPKERSLWSSVEERDISSGHGSRRLSVSFASQVDCSAPSDPATLSRSGPCSPSVEEDVLTPYRVASCTGGFRGENSPASDSHPLGEGPGTRCGSDTDGGFEAFVRTARTGKPLFSAKGDNASCGDDQDTILNAGLSFPPQLPSSGTSILLKNSGLVNSGVATSSSHHNSAPNPAPLNWQIAGRRLGRHGSNNKRCPPPLWNFCDDVEECSVRHEKPKYQHMEEIIERMNVRNAERRRLIAEQVGTQKET